MIKHQPLQWWADKITNKEYFSLARFGDGEFLCMEGKKGGNSHGCDYSPELREDLIACALNRDIYLGLQRITPKQFDWARRYTSLGSWFNTEEFADSLAVGKFKPFFTAITHKPVIIISSKEKRNVPIAYTHFIETPKTNAHLQKERIIKEILAFGQSGVYLFACGMAAGTFVSALHGKIKKAWFIDIGHVLDPFIGDPSREYLKTVSQEKLNENLP